MDQRIDAGAVAPRAAAGLAQIEAYVRHDPRAARAPCGCSSAFALPHPHVGTVWNNALVAIAVFVVSFTPGASGRPLTAERASA